MPSEGALIGFYVLGMLSGIVLTWLAQSFLSGGKKLERENRKLKEKNACLEKEKTRWEESEKKRKAEEEKIARVK